MNIDFDPNNGPAHMPDNRISVAEFKIVVPHIAEILDGCSRLGIGRLQYGFSVHLENGLQTLVPIIGMLEKKLPATIQFYEADNRKVFEFRGASGGVVSGYVCFLITKKDRYA